MFEMPEAIAAVIDSKMVSQKTVMSIPRQPIEVFEQLADNIKNDRRAGPHF